MVKMIKNLKKRMDKMQESTNTDLEKEETYRNNQQNY